MLTLFAGLALYGAWGASITTDEVAHLPAGYTYLMTGDFRLNPGHPPLMKALAAVPLLALDLRPVWSEPAWDGGDAWQFGSAFLTENRVPLRRMLFLGRLPMVAVGVLMGIVLAAWARDLWGEWPAVFVLFLFALCPNLLGHTALVTTDVGVACFTLITLYALWKFARTGALVHAAGCGVALGLALLAKYSALITAALVALLLAAIAVQARRARPSSSVALTPTRLVWAALLIAGSAALIVEVGFGFPTGLSHYVDGLRHQAGIERDAIAFLWGEHSEHLWYYFLLAQLWKTPLPTLLLFGCALVDRRARADRLTWFFLLLPIAALHAGGMLFRYKVGFRYMLPVLPFMFLACGAVARRVTDARRPARLAFAALCAWYAVDAARTAPHFLSYVNQLAGGPEYGVFYLGDSNIEWGQDLYRLKDYLDADPPARLRMAVVAQIGAEYYGIDAEPIRLRDLVWPETGVTYVVGAQYLQRRSFYPGAPLARFQWLDRYRPVDRVGGSLFVFRLSTDPADDGRPGVSYVPRAAWYDDAQRQLDAIVTEAPAFGEARPLLARVHAERARWLLSSGQAEAALADAVRAAQLAPDETAYRTELGEALAAVAAEPQADRARCGVGVVRARSDDVAAAFADLLACLRADPAHAAARAALAGLAGRWGVPDPSPDRAHGDGRT